MNNKPIKTIKKLTTLIIDRKRWLRRDSVSSSYLYREGDGKQCCLGFFCRNQGLSRNQIRGVSEPIDIGVDHCHHFDDVPYSEREKIRALFTKDYKKQNRICQSLMIINDYPKISELKREKRISELFKRIGVKVEFIN